MKLLNNTIKNIGSLNMEAMEKAQDRLDNLLKPQGSLGKLEDIARQLAGITGEVINTIDKKTIIVMCSDNGVTDEGISSYPRTVSLLVADTMVKGLSGVSVLARHAGADLKVVDIGLDGKPENNDIIDRKIRNATSNIAQGPAMTREEAVQAIEIGIEIAHEAIEEGAHIIGTGEIGIGNTTTSSAMLFAFTKSPLDEIVGRGAGLDNQGLENKKSIISAAVKMNDPDPQDPIDVLHKVGGFDIAGLTGCYLASAARRVPIIVDGFISGMAAVTASLIEPGVKQFMLTSHVSVEPGTGTISRMLGLKPMLDMNMRLGEGTGCALAFHLVDAAARVMREMGTFADIGM